MQQFVPLTIEVLNLFNAKNKFKSYKKIPLLDTIPVLFLASTADPIIRHQQMLSLLALCESKDKDLVPFEGHTHSSNREVASYWDHIRGFTRVNVSTAPTRGYIPG
jgi:alpha-beta hydrolase superfamily lysophospholipase